MPTRTSTQSGNFNSTSTWGGNPVPVDGDDFIINYGHVVTIDDDRRVTNGYNDSFVRGKLQITSTGKLRMNGILYVDNAANYTQHFVEGQNSGGFFRMDPGSKLEIRGTNADQHRLQVNGNGYVTCEIEGTNPNPKTTLSADANNNDTSLSFTDASNFAIGDWIAIYKAERSGKDWNYYKSDEGAWIHDIDVNTVYFRKFVSPKTTIINVNNNVISVSDSSVFRKGYKIIFGTGLNRNVLTITDINHSINEITVSSNVSGNVVGESIYETGLDKGHFSGDDVLRIAATITADSNAGSNTITVNNVNGFNVGDLILIPANDPIYANATSWDNIMDYTISSIDSQTKTITISAGYTNTNQSTLQRNVKSGPGGIVVNMTRDTKVTGPEGLGYGSGQASFIFFQFFSNSGNYHRRYKLKNFQLNIGSNTNSIEFRCLSIRGHNAFSLTQFTNYVCELEGVTITPTTRNTDNTGYIWEQHQLNIRNCVSYNAGGQCFYFYGNNAGFFNNVGIRASQRPWYCGGTYEAMTDFSYNYGIRTANGPAYEQTVDAKARISHNYYLFGNGTFLYNTYSANPLVLSRHYHDYYVVWASGERVGRVIFLDSYLGNFWDVTGGGNLYVDSVNMDARSYYAVNRGAAHSNMFSSINDNFKYNGLREWNRRALRLWDNPSQSWRVYPDRDDSEWMGFDNHVYVPSNTTVHVVGTVKTVSGNTNYPYIRVSHVKDYYDGRYYNNSDAILDPSDSKVNFTTGWRKIDRFTSSSVSDFETRTLTIDPLPFDTFMSISVSCDGSGANSRLGWYEKDLKIILTNPYPFSTSTQLLHNLTTRLPVVFQQTSSTLKTILGG
jgi:hypothetical protein